MSEWLTYNLSDFLLFSPRVYGRMFETYSDTLWPFQFLFLICTFAIGWMVWSPRSGYGRIAIGLLACMWVLVGYGFLIEQYASINPYALFAGYAFIFQAAALICCAAFKLVSFDAQRQGHVWLAVPALLIAAYPLIAMTPLNPIQGAEWVGITPDPTALFTLAVLALVSGRVRYILLIIPTLWVIASTLTLYTLGQDEWVLLIVLLALLMLSFILSFRSIKSVG